MWDAIQSLVLYPLAVVAFIALFTVGPYLVIRSLLDRHADRSRR